MPSPTCLTRQGGVPQGRCGHIGNDTGRSECQLSSVKPMEGFSMSDDKHPKITFRDYGPNDPFYKEGPQSYSPHWGRGLLKPKQPLPPKPERPPSKTLSDEQERLVAEIKRHHPKATSEQILRDLEAWGVE
jgi:hypothetical protein